MKDETATIRPPEGTGSAPAPGATAHLSPQQGSYHWVVLGVAVNAQTTASIVSQGIYTLVPFWALAYHLSRGSAALAVTAMNVGQIMSMMLLGWAIDRFGERSVVALTMIMMSFAAFGAAAWAPNYAMLLVWLLILGACYASVQPGGTRAVVRWFPPHLRGMAIGIRQAGLPLGTSLAAISLPLLAVKFGWPTAVFVQGVVGIFGGLLFWLFHRDDVGQETKGAKISPPKLNVLLRMLIDDVALWPVLIAGIAMASFQYTLSTHVLSFLSIRMEIEIVTAAFIFAVAQAVGIAGRISLTWVSDHWWPGRRLRSLGWTMLICAAALTVLLLLPPKTPVWILLAVFVIVGFFGIGWYPLWLVQVAELAPKNAIASTISFAMTLNLVAISIMPPVFGVVADVQGYEAAWALLVVMLVLSVIRLHRSHRTTLSA